MLPFFITVPHSGETVPDEAPWLKQLPETILMCDVDRFVDRLYKPAALELEVPIVITEWHRYMADLNRLPEDVDSSTVHGSANPPGKFNRGFLWAVTTTGEPLMDGPISAKVHRRLVEKCFEPFHQEVRALYAHLKKHGAKNVYHLDAHSMPSVGTPEHRDPGQRRPDVVISDSKGVSCSPAYKDLVIQSYESAGFKVGYNWPYYGGRITETYGKPSEGQHAIQAELNRSLYMNETTKQILPQADEIRERIGRALTRIRSGVASLPQ